MEGGVGVVCGELVGAGVVMGASADVDVVEEVIVFAVMVANVSARILNRFGVDVHAISFALARSLNLV